MNDSKTELFWKKMWVEALVMLPFGLLVAVCSAQFASGFGLISIVVGLVLMRLIYNRAILNKEGRLGGKSKGKIAIWLFSIQLIFVAFLGVLIAFLP